MPGAWVTGPVPRRLDFEDTGGEFFLDDTCTQRDAIHDDLALWLQTSQGIVVVLGCAHSGVCNTLNYVIKLTGRPIFAVLGGLHLVNATPERSERTTEFFRNLGLKLLAAGHCTGTAAIRQLHVAFPKTLFPCAGGADFTLSPEIRTQPWKK